MRGDGGVPAEEAAGPALWPSFLMVALVTSGFGAAFAVLAEFRDRYGFSDIGVGLIASSGFFAGFVAQVGLARYADRGHTRVMLRAGLVLVVLSMAGMAVGTTLLTLVGARALLGVAAGMIIPAVRRIVIVADPERIGTNLGRLGAFDVAGFTVGPAVAAALVEVAGIRAPFVVLGVAVAACSPFVLARTPTASLAVHGRRPVRALLGRRNLVAMLVIAAGFFMMIGTFEATWAVLMTDRGAATWFVGVTISLFALPMIVLSPLGGRLAQRHGPMRTAAAGMLLAVPCVVAYGFVPALVLLALLAAVQSAFDAVTFPSTQVGVAVASPPDQLAAAQGLLGATEALAGGSMALLAGFLYDAGGAGLVYPVTAAIMVATVVAGVGLGRELLRPPPVRAVEARVT